jgi:hypothetical protein
LITTTSGSPEELPTVGVPSPKGSSGSAELGFELIVFPISLRHYQLTIPPPLDQPFLIIFLLIFDKNHAPNAALPGTFSAFRFFKPPSITTA